jgi:hypothetical protein
MKTVKNILVGLKRFAPVRIDPHFVLLILVIVFFVLLFAAENVIKHTLISQ